MTVDPRCSLSIPFPILQGNVDPGLLDPDGEERAVFLVIVMWLLLAVPWVGLQFVIVVFPDHTNYFL